MQKNGFAEVYCPQGEQPVFCYRSGMAVYEEALIHGVMVSQGYNAAGYPLNVLTNFPTRLDPKHFAEPFAFELVVNGVQAAYDLSIINVKTDKTPHGVHAVVSLQSGVLPLVVHLHTELDGTAVFVRWLELENTSDEPLTVSHVAMMAGGLEELDAALIAQVEADAPLYSLGYFDGDAWGEEGQFAWHPLMPDVTAVDMQFGRGRYRHPLMMIKNEATGTMWCCQIAYAGGCRFVVDYDPHYDGSGSSALAFKAEMTGYAPLLVINSHETVATPEVHMGVLHGGLDDAVNAMHDHARRSVLNDPLIDGSALLVGAGMGAEHDMSVETTKAFMDQFAAMGAEMFIIDAGWQNPPHEETAWEPYNGLNRPDAARYPNGIGELRDYCHQKGMKFAMWVEIERLGAYSNVYKEHPEWRLENIYREPSRGCLDMTNPAAAKWAEEELARLIETLQLDMLRIDHNIHHAAYRVVKPSVNGVKEYTPWRHTQAVNAMYRRLKQRFPQVIFENCAGGGGRTDYATMRAFHHTWVSDWQKMPRSVTITNGMTMALPPERVDRLVAGMGCHTVGSFDAHVRNAMFGHISLNVIAPAEASWNTQQMAFVQHSITVYKTHIRPMLPNAAVYHAVPDYRDAFEKGYMTLEVAAKDGSSGAIGIFTLTHGNRTALSIIPRGVDAGAVYRVTWDNTAQSAVVSGYDLLTRGIPVCVEGAMASELILYKKIEAS